MVTWIAFRQPRACSLNRSTGLFATIPALLLVTLKMILDRTEPDRVAG